MRTESWNKVEVRRFRAALDGGTGIFELVTRMTRASRILQAVEGVLDTLLLRRPCRRRSLLGKHASKSWALTIVLVVYPAVTYAHKQGNQSA